MIITLPWKEFNVDTGKVRSYFLEHLSDNFDGLSCDVEGLSVVFFSEASEEDSNKINTYWNNITLATFAPTIIDIATAKLDEATVFGAGLIRIVTIENIAMGITVYNKTKEVSDYLRAVQRYLQSGSLYAAMEEIDRLIGIGIDPNLAPFVTEARMFNNKTKIKQFLGIP